MQGIGDVFSIGGKDAEFPNAYKNFYSNDFYSNDFAPKDVRQTCGGRPLCICRNNNDCCKRKDRYNQCASDVTQYNVSAITPPTDTTTGGGSSTPPPPQDTVSAPATPHDTTGGVKGGAKGGNVPPTGDDGSKTGAMGMSTGMWVFIIVALLVIGFLAYKNFTHKKPQ